MNYKYFIPTYSHRFIPTDKIDMKDVSEYWTSKVLQTQLKLAKLYDDMIHHSAIPLDSEVRDVKSKVGMWAIEREIGHHEHYRRRNLITNSEWEPIYEHINVFQGIPHKLWLESGVMIVLPSKETIEWLNMLSYLYCVSNKRTV